MTDAIAPLFNMAILLSRPDERQFPLKTCSAKDLPVEFLTDCTIVS